MAQPDALGHHVAIGLGGGQLDVDGLLPQFGLRHEVGQAQVAVGTRHQVGPVLVEQLVLHALGHAAQHTYNQLSLPPQGVQRLQPSVNLLLGIVAHRTGVQQHAVGLVDAVADLVARHLHHAGHHLRVGHVHLAAVGLNKQFFHLKFEFGCKGKHFCAKMLTFAHNLILNRSYGRTKTN